MWSVDRRRLPIYNIHSHVTFKKVSTNMLDIRSVFFFIRKFPRYIRFRNVVFFFSVYIIYIILYSYTFVISPEKRALAARQHMVQCTQSPPPSQFDNNNKTDHRDAVTNITWFSERKKYENRSECVN